MVAEETRCLESTQEEDGGSSSKSKNNAQQGSFLFAVVGRFFVVLVERVVRVQVSEKTTGAKGTSNGIEDENGHNQQGEDVIGESSRVSDISRQVKKGSNRSERAGPDTDIGVERKEGDIQVQTHFVDNSRHDQHGTGRSNNNLVKRDK